MLSTLRSVCFPKAGWLAVTAAVTMGVSPAMAGSDGGTGGPDVVVILKGEHGHGVVKGFDRHGVHHDVVPAYRRGFSPAFGHNSFTRGFRGAGCHRDFWSGGFGRGFRGPVREDGFHRGFRAGVRTGVRSALSREFRGAYPAVPRNGFYAPYHGRHR